METPTLQPTPEAEAGAREIAWAERVHVPDRHRNAVNNNQLRVAYPDMGEGDTHKRVIPEDVYTDMSTVVIFVLWD